jgi:hypothetical protein
VCIAAGYWTSGGPGAFTAFGNEIAAAAPVTVALSNLGGGNYDANMTPLLPPHAVAVRMYLNATTTVALGTVAATSFAAYSNSGPDEYLGTIVSNGSSSTTTASVVIWLDLNPLLGTAAVAVNTQELNVSLLNDTVFTGPTYQICGFKLMD